MEASAAQSASCLAAGAQRRRIDVGFPGTPGGGLSSLRIAAALLIAQLALGCCARAAPCHTDFDCSFNGKCSAGLCVCSPAWTGSYCHELNFLPANNRTGLNQLQIEPPISHWGAAVLLGDDDLYHMYASEIVNSCGVHAWCSNSQIVHATSPTAAGLYTRKEVIFKVFSHEPQVVRAPTGEYVMYFTHYPNGSATEFGVCNCSGSGGNSHAFPGLPKCGGSPLNVSDPGPLSTYFSYSSSPNGPWSTPELLISTTGRFDTNLSPYIFANGSVLAWTRGQIWTASHWKIASSWKSTGGPMASEMTFSEGEDPHLWRDRNGRFHVLSHNGKIHTGGSSLQPSGDCGRHLFSATGLAGTWFGVPNTTLPDALGGCAYPRVNVTWADGSLKHFSSRERPHLVFGKDPDVPLALTNAVIDSTDLPTYLFDKAYTLVQPISTK
eukprot:SAG31_NODE_984_length_10552_cov_4.679231_13_plen_438_part_00